MCQKLSFVRSLVVAAVYALGCISTLGQSVASIDNRKERKPPTNLNAEANGLRKLPFEQSIIIYYNVPTTAPAASPPKSSPIQNETSKAGSTVATSRPRIQTQPNTAQQQTRNSVVLEPIFIYYPGSPKGALATTISTLPTKGAASNAEPLVRTKPGAVDLSVINIESKQPAPTQTSARPTSGVTVNDTEHEMSTLPGVSGEVLRSSPNQSASALVPAVTRTEPKPNTVQENRSVQNAEINEPGAAKAAEKTDPLPNTTDSGNEVSVAAALKGNSESAPAGATEIAFENMNAADGPIAMNNAAVEMTNDAKYADAESLLEKAISAQPKNAKFHRNLSVVFERMNKLDEALASARTAADFAPRDPSVLDQLCVLELAHGSAASAAECYEKLDSIKPLDVLAQAYYGTALFRSGKIKESEPVLEKAARSRPPLAEALNALGMMYFTTKRIDEAIATFKNGVEADPELCDVRYNLAVAYLSIHNKPGALSQYNILKSSNSKLADQLYRALFSDKLVFVDELKREDR